MRKLHRYLLPMIATAAALADGNMSRPVAGYVIDGQTQLRPILGVPGAFTFDGPLASPEAPARIWLAPGQTFALTESASGALAIQSLAGTAVSPSAPLPGAMQSPDWIAFSPTAGSALLFFGSARRAQVVAGLPQAPRLILDQDISGQEPLTSGAVSDDGSTIVLASISTVYLLAGGQLQVLISPGAVVSVTMLRNGFDAAVSDDNGTVYQIRNLASRPQAQVVTTGLGHLGALFPAWDGKSLFVARPGDRSISVIDLSSGDVHTFPTPVAAVRLSPLRNRDTFLIASEAHEPGWIFYWDGTGGRVAFIPAAEAEDQQNRTAGGNH
jgi:hypothetical protein